MSLTKRELKLPEELLRLKIKDFEEEARFKFSKKVIVDIFEILEGVSFFIRKPLDIYFNNEFVCF